ncbi:MAG: DNA adenine methylase [Cuniculiplasma sp.]
MKKLRLMKYPGSKWVSIPDINNTWKESQCQRFVDVFGGSASVSLNMGSGQTVYNEIDTDLFNLFLCLRDNFEEFMKNAKRWTSGVKAFNDYRHHEEPDNLPEVEKMVSDAFRTFYRYNTTFGGMGETYFTGREKSTYTGIVKSVAHLPAIKERIGNWKIENMDFRELIKKYDSEDTFFYMDPPYAGKSWYNKNFTSQDFRDLSILRKEMKGKYLINFDTGNDSMKRVFGEPQFTKKYVNMNGNAQDMDNPFRYMAFYTSVIRTRK